jgi:peptide deformylase
VEAYELTGQKFRLSSDGILARVIQHEFDHLQGVLFTEKISDYTKLLDLEFYRETVRNDPDQIAASKITVKDFLIL